MRVRETWKIPKVREQSNATGLPCRSLCYTRRAGLGHPSVVKVPILHQRKSFPLVLTEWKTRQPQHSRLKLSQKKKDLSPGPQSESDLEKHLLTSSSKHEPLTIEPHLSV